MLAEPSTTDIHYCDNSSSDNITHNHLYKVKIGIAPIATTRKRRQSLSTTTRTTTRASLHRLSDIVLIVNWCMLLFFTVSSYRATKTATVAALSTHCGALLSPSTRTTTTARYPRRPSSPNTAHFGRRHHITSSSAISSSTSPPQKIQSRQQLPNHHHPPNNNNSAMTTPTKAKYIPATLPSLHSASSRLLSGDLVSFPTETVYGLGAHALNETAIQKIFDAKERPTTDPLIVHLNSLPQAVPLWAATAAHDDGGAGAGGRLERSVLTALTTQFWPGPLTIVARASPCVPSLLMAGTGYVACRSPRHPIARALIAGGADPSAGHGDGDGGGGGIPIAAPSANKFGHVSPTRPRHVMDDLGGEDVWIVDPALGGLEDGDGGGGGGCCDVGVESTVVKVEMTPASEGEEGGVSSATIILLRHGAVSEGDIATCLRQTPYGNGTLADHVRLLSKPRTTGSNTPHVAPGQTLKHYSPNVPSYIISRRRYSALMQQSQSDDQEWNDDERRQLRTAVVIDFGGRLQSTQSLALAYRDLDEGGDSNVAAANVFDLLRWSETVEGAERVYFPEIGEEEDSGGSNALVLAVKDRLTRAASGVVVDTLI